MKGRQIFRSTHFMFTIIVVFLSIISSLKAFALNITANSCSQADVQLAVSQVISGGGGIVYIPAGASTWTTGVTVNTGSTKNIKIIGAGQGVTTINDFYLIVPASGSNVVEIAHMTIGSSIRSGGIFSEKFRPANSPGSKELHFHDLTISGRGPIGTIEGWNGVVNNNTFNCRSGQYGWYVHGYGNYDSTRPAMGTRSSIFFENNTFNGCYHSISGFCNSKIVFRYNTVAGSTHCVDVHGPSYNYCQYASPVGTPNGGRLFEHYNNIYEANSVCGAKLRSGSGISTGNNYKFTSDGWWSFFGVYNDQTCSSCNHTYVYPPTESGACQGVQEYWVWNETCPATTWSNSEIGSGCFNVSNNSCPGCIRENTEYYLRAPTSTQDGITWTPFTYPHPITVSGLPPLDKVPNIVDNVLVR